MEVNGQTLTKETIALFANAFATPEFKKAVTLASGPQYYDLEPEVKSLFPLITPIRNEIPRFFSKQKGDVATHWQAITAINTASMPPVVNEGRRAGAVSSTYVSKLAKYATLGLEDSVTEEARLAAMGYDDVDARTVANLIFAMMQMEEVTYIGGDNSLMFGTTPTPTLSQTTGSSGFADAAVVRVAVMALTLEGYYRASRNGGVPVPTVTRTVVGSTLAAGPVTETIAGGCAQVSAEATITASANNTVVSATVALVAGAVAYAWYCSTGGAGTSALAFITTINSAVFTAAGTGSQTQGSLPASDNSGYNNAPTGIDGLITIMNLGGSGSVVTALATGTPGAGTALTSPSSGVAITQIDAVLKQMWDTYNLGPDTIWVNSQELTNITALIFAAGGAPLVRYAVDAKGVTDANNLSLSAGVVIGTYLNKFVMGGPTNIAVRLHPNIPPGSILFTSKRIPFPNSNVTDVLRVRGQLDYHQIVWGPFTRSAEYGVYMRGTLQCYFPGAFAMLTNIGA